LAKLREEPHNVPAAGREAIRWQLPAEEDPKGNPLETSAVQH